ncbi:MAG: hypothetical protein U9Q81_09870 [Pseudomonadota bacterium]|nr:hypothetical protein [Pseudomonadota bacterium]
MSDSDTKPKRRSLSRWFWGGFFSVLLVGLVVTLFAAIRGGGTWLQEQLGDSELPPVWTKAIRVTLAPGESVYLDAAALARTRAEVLAVLGRRRGEAEKQLTHAIDQGLERIFAETDKQVPVFADWYFSLTGEYMRLFNAAFGDLAAFLAERLDELVFVPADTAQGIDDLSSHLGEASVAQVADTISDVRGLLVDLVRQSGLPEAQIRVTGEWDLSAQLTTHLQPYVALTPEDIARQGVAASAGAVAAAATAKKLGSAAVATAAAKLAAKPSVGAASVLAAKLGLKSAAKAGGTLGATGTGAAAGAVLCAGTVAGAPLSPACALVGGAVSGLTAWLLVDKAVIEADEYLNRDEFEVGLREALAEQRSALRNELETRYVGGAGAVLERLGEDFETQLAPRPIEPKKDFVPAQSASGL